jgi:hypothetical protein
MDKWEGDFFLPAQPWLTGRGKIPPHPVSEKGALINKKPRPFGGVKNLVIIIPDNEKMSIP